MGSNDLNVRITGKDDTGPAYASAQASQDAYMAALERSSAQITGKLSNVEKAIEGIGKTSQKTEEDIKKLAEPMSEVSKALEHLGERFAEAFSVKDIMAEVSASILSVIGPLVLLEKAADTTFEALKHGVELNEQFEADERSVED